MSVNLLNLNEDWQQKRPELILKNNEITFKGYQNYKLGNDLVPLDKKLKKKTKLIKPELQNLNYNSILDLGCAGLYFGLLAKKKQKLVGVEVDIEYVEALKELSKYSNIDFEIVESRLDLFKPNEKYDLVFALAIIHWIYSCSSYFGSLKNVIEFLANLTNKYIFIEFVSETDPVTKKLNHIEFNEAEGDYSKKNFLKYINEQFKECKYLGNTKSTRELYLCKK